MSGVTSAEECEEQGLAELCPRRRSRSSGRGIQQHIDFIMPRSRRASGKNLSAKKDLYPFEEAKLYGHNAIHFLLGCLGKAEGKEFMSELGSMPELMEKARKAFIDECGAALCKKWQGVDELFTADGFKAYAENLLERMTNPFLKDARDQPHHPATCPANFHGMTGSIGTIRVVLSQDV